MDVTFRSDQRGNVLATEIAHEGVTRMITGRPKLLVRISRTTNPSVLRGWLSRTQRKGLGLRLSPPGSGDFPASAYQIWNRGWKTADVETYRARGVANILRDYYPDSEKSDLPLH